MNHLSEQTDVLIVGGGTAGAIAALQAARAGVRTTVVEMTGQLDGSPMPDFSRPPPHRPSHHVGVNPALFAALVEEACLDAGVTLRYHELATAVTAAAEGWCVTCVGKNLTRTIQARELIDCTGDADLVGMLGYDREYGEERQPGTLAFRFGGYDAAALDNEAIETRYQQALRDGRLLPGDFCCADRPFIEFLRRGGGNMLHLAGADSSTAASQTAANIAGRQGVLRLLRFVRELPGCEKTQLLRMGSDTAVRETWRIVGETRVTREDYLSGRVYPDAVGYTFYFIDLHQQTGILQEFLADGIVPTLPRGALVPKGSRRLLVAGRCLASDRLANSALRVEASCMAMGQGAGAAAALGVKLDVDSRDVPIADLRALLAAHGAILP